MKRYGKVKIKELLQKLREIINKFFCRHKIEFEFLMKMASKTDKWKGFEGRDLAKIENCLSL